MATNSEAVMALAVAHFSLVSLLSRKGVITLSEHNEALSKFSKGLKNVSPEVLSLIDLLRIEEDGDTGSNS